MDKTAIPYENIMTEPILKAMFRNNCQIVDNWGGGGEGKDELYLYISLSTFFLSKGINICISKYTLCFQKNQLNYFILAMNRIIIHINDNLYFIREKPLITVS